MEEVNKHIKSLAGKIQLLVKRHADLLAENLQQKALIEKLKEKETADKERILVLEQQQLILKASLDQMDEKEKKELETKLNGYVKNIDKCISLLSHKQNA